MVMKKITRLDVLKKAKGLYVNGICRDYSGLCKVLRYSIAFFGHYIPTIVMHRYLPLFTFENAKKFGANGDKRWYWWKPYEWDTGRLDFLNWLIEQYRDDDTNLFEWR
jgi:hypothetical protein